MRVPLVLLFVGMTAVIALLLLNLSEVDYYPGGEAEPPPVTDFPEAYPVGMTEEVVCACACGHCHHRRRVERSRMTLRIVDRDGWYRLWNAADDVYYFAHPAQFLMASQTATCARAEGAWDIVIGFDRACGHRYPAHDCEASVPLRVTMRYEGRIVLEPSREFALWRDPTGRVQVPSRVTSLGIGTEAFFQGRVVKQDLYLEWVLAAPPQVEYGPCRCR